MSVPPKNGEKQHKTVERHILQFLFLQLRSVRRPFLVNFLRGIPVENHHDR
jgi:hypothetical protein